MNTGKYIFAQLTEFLPRRQFDIIVDKYKGNHYVKHFTCWNHMLCMMFGQLSHRESLSDLVLCIEAHKNKSYHLGLGRSISKNNLAKANENRDWKLYADYAFLLIGQARKECIPENLGLTIDENIYAFDSSVIDLCLSVFWWAKFRRAKGAVKLHTLLDVKTNIPCFLYITEASVHDVNALDKLEYENGSYYVLDRAYVDFKRLYRINKANAFFVTRGKVNFRYNIVNTKKTNNKDGIMRDQIISLPGVAAKRNYPEKLRRIMYHDEEKEKVLVFITNNFELSAKNIALLYKYRWRIELFFKWIKQHLKVLTFWGTSSNAVKTQIYIAIITYTLVAIVKSRLKCERSNYEILQILSISLIDKIPISELINKSNLLDICNQDDAQLKLF